MPTPHELRLLADQLEAIEKLEQTAAKAKQAYQDKPGDAKLKAAHRKASQELADARREASEAGVMAVANDPGSTTIVPAPVQSGTTA